MKSIMVAAVAAGSLVATAAFAAVPWTTQWSSPQVISSTPEPGAGPENGTVATSTSGSDAVAVWTQYQGDSRFRVWAATTHDAGVTWEAPIALSNASVNAEFPDLSLSDDGMRATAVWYANVPSGYAMRAAFTTDGGQTWTPRTIAGPIDASRNPHVAVSADGTRVIATWAEYDGVDDVVKVSHSSDGGDTWSTPADVSGSTGDDPAIAISADGMKAIASFTQYDGSNGRATVRTSSDGGATWNPAVTLSAEGEGANQPQIALSDDGNQVTAVWSWSGGSQERVQARSSSDGGVTWTPAADLSEAGRQSTNAQIAASASGSHITVAWQGDDGSRMRVLSSSSTDDGTTWTTPVTHSEAGSSADNPHVAVSADGTSAAVVWYRLIDFNPSRVEAAVSADRGATWSEPDVLSDTTLDSMDPQAAMSANGRRLHTTWAGSADDSYVRASAGTLRTVPGSPTGALATAGDAQVTAFWTAPVDDGGSPITGYTAVANPGGQTCSTSGTSCTIGGLANGTAYTVTVSATNTNGTGPASAASNVVTPTAPPAPAPAPAPTPDPPSTKVKAKANDAKSKLKVTIKPDLGKKKQWEFVVKVKKKGDWKTIKTKKGKTKVYETEGSDHKLTIDLDEGKYKAKSKEARGYQADTSDVVKLKK